MLFLFNKHLLFIFLLNNHFSKSWHWKSDLLFFVRFFVIFFFKRLLWCNKFHNLKVRCFCLLFLRCFFLLGLWLSRRMASCLDWLEFAIADHGFIHSRTCIPRLQYHISDWNIFFRYSPRNLLLYRDVGQEWRLPFDGHCFAITKVKMFAWVLSWS